MQIAGIGSGWDGGLVVYDLGASTRDKVHRLPIGQSNHVPHVRNSGGGALCLSNSHSNIALAGPPPPLSLLPCRLRRRRIHI
jgi:hypothetical protein